MPKGVLGPKFSLAKTAVVGGDDSHSCHWANFMAIRQVARCRNGVSRVASRLARGGKTILVKASRFEDD